MTALLALAPALPDARAQGRHAAMVIDANTGAVLHAQSADELRHPASLTKMMTLYLAFEQIEQGRLSYGSKIKMSQEAAAAPPSKLDLDPGEEIELNDAIKALITKSANDIAVAIGERIAGSEIRFAALMTERARQLGMTSSVFRNASGLPDSEQVTTARDMLTLALRLQDDFPRHYPLFQLKHFSYQGDSYRNHNSLLFNYQGTDGIKTGYTRMSGFNLVSSVRRDGKHVVGAVFGGASAGARDAHMRMILTRALQKASTERTRRVAPALIARAKPVPQPVLAQRPGPEPRVAAAPEARRLPVGEEPRPLTPPAPVEVARGRLAVASAPIAGRSDAPLRGSLAEPPAERRVMLPPVPRADPSATTEPPLARSPAPARAIAPPPPAPPVQASPPTQPGRGLPPSSLQAQASRLALGGLGGLTPPATAAGAAGLHIQVGAYATSAEAERQIGHVRGRAPSLLQSRPPLVMAVQKESRQLYRARFAGFDAASAAAACLELRRLAVDCFVMRAE